MPELQGFKLRAIWIFRSDPFSYPILSTIVSLPLSSSLTILFAAGCNPTLSLIDKVSGLWIANLGRASHWGCHNLDGFQMPSFSPKIAKLSSNCKAIGWLRCHAKNRFSLQERQCSYILGVMLLFLKLWLADTSEITEPWYDPIP